MRSDRGQLLEIMNEAIDAAETAEEKMFALLLRPDTASLQVGHCGQTKR